MKVRKSIRWRMLAWIAIFLSLTLSALGFTAYRIYFGNALNRVDQELRARVAMLSVALFAAGPNPAPVAQSPDSSNSGANSPRPLPRAAPQGSSLEQAQIVRAIRRFEASNTNHLYFVIWRVGFGDPYEESANAPSDVSRPQVKFEDTGTYARSRGGYRENYHATEAGDCVLVGCSLASEISQSRRFAVWLSLGSVFILVCGLGGMWLILSHALQPVKRISAAAENIAAGNLSERINSRETESEMGQLVAVLNSTFARLETAFNQQKQFTADAAHELRTPIAVMISEAQTTLARERGAAEYRAALDANLATAQQMRQLTDALLELARLDGGQDILRREKVDLSAVATDCINLVRPLAEKRHLSIQYNLTPVEVLADGARIHQVITNLLTNAVRYNREHGEIRVSTRHHDGAACLTVADTGLGISSVDLPRVFERFYRGDKARTTEGAGLGLSICKAIVEAHGGSIEVSSPQNKGATFTVCLPLAGD